MKEVWEVLDVVMKIVGWYLIGVVSIGAFNGLWEPTFNLKNLNKTTAKLLALALLGPIIFILLCVYILYILAISSFYREWDVASEFVEYILLGFNEWPRRNKRTIEEEL